MQNAEMQSKMTEMAARTDFDSNILMCLNQHRATKAMR